MTKKIIGVGAAVDDFTGDYLRQGGQKINDNFTELYSELGDGSRPHQAGAWKTWDAAVDGFVLNPLFGESYHIDTQAGPVTVNLPLIGSELGRAIKLSDIKGSWASNPITIEPDPLDSINGATSTVIDENFRLVELMSSETTDWKFIEGMFHNKITIGATTLIKDVIDIVDDSDASGLHTVAEHTASSINVYLNGVLLRYDPDPLELGPGGKSEYGSSLSAPDTLTAIGVMPLQIQLRPGIYQADDTLIIEIFSGDISGARTSYTRYSRLLVNAPTVNEQELYCSTVVADECQNVFLGVGGANLPDLQLIRPSNFQVFYNGVLMTSEGEAGYTPSGNNQYRLFKSSPTEPYDTISFTAPTIPPLFGTDVISFVLFNNVIGTLLSEEEIITIIDDIAVGQSTLILNNTIQYNNTIPDGAGEINTKSDNVTNIFSVQVTIDSVQKMFEYLYPVGTIYSSASNPANPVDYFKFGTWVKYGVGRTSFGHSNTDTAFDECGEIGGAYTTTIDATNLPEMAVTPDGTVLTLDNSGTVDVSGCLPDPNAPIVYPASISTGGQVVNDGSPNTPISIVPPHIVEYKWVRVA